jgi:hypothetical protein
LKRSRRGGTHRTSRSRRCCLPATVVYRSFGWSLYPSVYSNDLTTYEPVTSADRVAEKDVVFCGVQLVLPLPCRSCVVQKVGCINRCRTAAFRNSNTKGEIDGWCYADHIYGRRPNVSTDCGYIMAKLHQRGCISRVASTRLHLTGNASAGARHTGTDTDQAPRLLKNVFIAIRVYIYVVSGSRRPHP